MKNDVVNVYRLNRNTARKTNQRRRLSDESSRRSDSDGPTDRRTRRLIIPWVLRYFGKTVIGVKWQFYNLVISLCIRIQCLKHSQTSLCPWLSKIKRVGNCFVFQCGLKSSPTCSKWTSWTCLPPSRTWEDCIPKSQPWASCGTANGKNDDSIAILEGKRQSILFIFRVFSCGHVTL